MKISKYIYTANETGQYIVRFRDRKGKYVQKMFGNIKNPKEALKRAKSWRDENLPSFRKYHSVHARHLLVTPLKRKFHQEFPAGIQLHENKIKRKGKSYSYFRFIASLGWDKNKKMIQKTFCITKQRTEKEALEQAIEWRKEKAKECRKEFLLQ